MRLELGRRADYAIRATLHLAGVAAGDERVKSRVIAEAMEIPASYVAPILAELAKAGIVDSVAGPQGGYRLARSAGDLTLAEVVAAVELEATPPRCILRGGPCRWDDMCAVHVPWLRATDAIAAELESTTFAEVLEIDRALELGSYEVPEDLRDRWAGRIGRPGERDD
ncbi:MAG: Rrf2 family transcriptional regulator [Nitriliruptoraceae bacterium]|nr:Rrf2 family transcriptional regulator [Nitriliruptoraceae bacterium]